MRSLFVLCASGELRRAEAVVGGPDPRINFEVSLGELERCANDSMRQMSDAMNGVLARWPSDQPVIKAVGSPQAMNLVYAVLGTLGDMHDQQVRGAQATEATRRSLGEIATTYRRADGFPGDAGGW